MEINNIVKEDSLKTPNNTTDGMLKKDEEEMHISGEGRLFYEAKLFEKQ